jgi:hypothetical protein
VQVEVFMRIFERRKKETAAEAATASDIALKAATTLPAPYFPGHPFAGAVDNGSCITKGRQRHYPSLPACF